jgi:hypothetical protein
MPRDTCENVIMTTGNMIMQGDLLPEEVFPPEDIQSWLDEGRIERADVTVEQVDKAERIRLANPFRADPSILVGKTREDLVIMVLEIDPDYDTDKLVDEQAMVTLLTSGWDDKFEQTIAPVSDRSRPEALALGKLHQEGGMPATSNNNPEMSAEARSNLDAARAKAQAPKSEE